VASGSSGDSVTIYAGLFSGCVHARRDI